MTTERKQELAQMCRLEIRRTVTLAKMAMADYGYHLAETVLDVEISAMMQRLTDKSVRSGDISLLRELVIEDLWPRLRDAHKEHRDNVFDAVKKMDRETISPDASFAFDIGWRMLLQSVAERLQTYPTAWKARIVGGKEKFGCCVIYIDFDGSQRGARSEIERLREEIRLRSLATCEICGNNGRLRLSSIAKTVCDKHAAVLGELRDDDGMWADPYRWRDERPIEDHIDYVIKAAREIMAAAEESALGKRIDEDTWQRRGREQELLIEFSGVIEDVVNGAVVKDEYLDDYIAKELDGWRTTAVVPVSARDREFLHGYLRELIDADRNK